jgi:hypothetical protein
VLVEVAVSFVAQVHDLFGDGLFNDDLGSSGYVQLVVE